MSSNKKPSRFNLSKRKVSLLMLFGATIGLSANAQASAYAVSTTTISNFGVAITGSGTLNAFSFNSNTAALNGTGTGNGGTTDAASSCLGCGYTNSFSAHGNALPDYAYGDTKILNSSVSIGAGSAASIGESLVTNGIGSASGINSMLGSFNLNSASTINFNFSASNYMQTILSAGGQAATANVNMTITISDVNGATVFSWAPDGNTGGITGGTENLDSFNLNRGSGQSTLLNSTGSFSATTASLAAGFYNVNITAKDSSFVSAVPVPAAVWLLGSGLLGLVGIARRKTA